jgi:hypothetical protein
MRTGNRSALAPSSASTLEDQRMTLDECIDAIWSHVEGAGVSRSSLLS